jgi:hypothetical protein
LAGALLFGAAFLLVDFFVDLFFVVAFLTGFFFGAMAPS